MDGDSLDQMSWVFRTLAEKSMDAIAITDLEGKLIYANQACYNLFGYEQRRQEMAGLNFASLRPEGEEMPPQAEEWHGELRLKRKDGSLFEAYAVFFSLTDEIGKAVGRAAIIRDISERKQMELTLARERDLLHTLMDNSPDYLFFKDRESRFIITNKAHAQQLLGLSSPQEAVGKTDFDFFPKKDAQRFYEEEQRIMETRRPVIAREWQVPSSTTGEIVWLSEHKLPITDEKGQVIGLLGISRNVTERKRAEEELAKERNLLRTLIDNLPDLIYIKDTEGRYIVSNVSHARFLGAKSPDEVVGKTVFELFPQEMAAQYFADDQEVIRSGQPLLEREERSVDQEGNLVWHLTTKVPLRDSEGKVIGLVGIARNITERKRAEELIEAQRQAIRELSTPIVPVLEGVLVLPLVGGIDTGRAGQIMETLLEAIGQYQAQVVIMDITGVPVVDTGVANHLLQVTRAATLLGAECVLVGISPEVAQTIVSLGVDLSGIITRRDLQSGVEYALGKLNRRIVST